MSDEPKRELTGLSGFLGVPIETNKDLPDGVGVLFTSKPVQWQWTASSEASTTLTMDKMRATVREIEFAARRPNAMILSPKAYARLQWVMNRTKPWPMDVELWLFPRLTRIQRWVKRRWRKFVRR